MEQVLVQAYFDGCSLDWMVGTREYPFYIVGILETRGNTYLVGVSVTESLGEVDGLIFRYKIEWEYPIKIVIDSESNG